MSALLFAEICAEAGLPAGVFNVITGNGAMGQVLAEHPDVDKVGFTGSTGMVKNTNLIFFDNSLWSLLFTVSKGFLTAIRRGLSRRFEPYPAISL